MKSTQTIRILTFGVQKEKNTPAILPSMVMDHADSLADLKKKSISLAIMLILLGEAEAEEALQQLVPLRDQMTDTEIIVICRENSANITRHWTAQGAASVWTESEWGAELIEYGGGSEVMIEPSRLTLHTKETKVIAVATVFSGGGSTYTSLMIAQYLRKKMKAKVAIWEGVPQGKEKLRTLHYILNGRNTSPGDRLDRLYSNVEGISFFDNTIDDQTLETAQQDFDYIVYDMGELSQSSDELLFFRAHVPILIGSSAEYRWGETTGIFNRFQNRRHERVQIVVPFSTVESLKGLQQLNPGRLIHSMPVHHNPLKVEESSSEVIETLLSTIMYKEKKSFAKILGFKR